MVYIEEKAERKKRKEVVEGCGRNKGLEEGSQREGNGEVIWVFNLYLLGFW